MDMVLHGCYMRGPDMRAGYKDWNISDHTMVPVHKYPII